MLMTQDHEMCAVGFWVRENANLKLVLVEHPKTECYRLPILKDMDLLALRSGTETRNGGQIRNPRKVWGR